MTRISAIAAAAALAASAAGIAWAQEGPSAAGDHVLDFKAIDTDGNGSLSRAELQARAVARLGRADANGDGSLDREELVAIFPAREGAPFRVFSMDPATEKVDRLLALLGATEAGRVEVTVLADRRVNMLLAEADTDRDAAISQTEAAAVDAHRSHHHERRGDRGEGQRGGRETRMGPHGEHGMEMGPHGGRGMAMPEHGGSGMMNMPRHGGAGMMNMPEHGGAGMGPQAGPSAPGGSTDVPQSIPVPLPDPVPAPAPGAAPDAAPAPDQL